VTRTTSFGPRRSVGRAHSTEPTRAVTCTRTNSPMISSNEKPSVLAAKTAAKVITVFTPSS
jgi:hypothetical protein